jgi:hypothetical protein
MTAMQEMLQATATFKLNAAIVNAVLEKTGQKPIVSDEIMSAIAEIDAIIKRNHKRLRDHVETHTETVHLN